MCGWPKLRSDQRYLIVNGVKRVLRQLLGGLYLAVPGAATGVGNRVLEQQHVQHGHAGYVAEGTAGVLINAGADSAAGTVNHGAHLGQVNLHQSEWSGSIDLVAAQRWVAEIHVQPCSEHLSLKHGI